MTAGIGSHYMPSEIGRRHRHCSGLGPGRCPLARLWRPLGTTEHSERLGTDLNRLLCAYHNPYGWVWILHLELFCPDISILNRKFSEHVFFYVKYSYINGVRSKPGLQACCCATEL